MKPFVFVLLALLSGCSVLSPSYEALNDPSHYKNYNPLQSSKTSWLVFGNEKARTQGIVFYPGGKVEPEAYSSLASAMSLELNQLVVIVPMPLDLAILGSKRGDKVQDHFTNISKWTIGGHSLGGVMAASRISKSPESWDRLFLIASYPQDTLSLSNQTLPVISILGSQDGLVSHEIWQSSLELLPATTVTKLIDGGNHAGFGDYGPQEGDLTASISPSAQREETIKALKNWIK
jgi:hypothetical protein